MTHAQPSASMRRGNGDDLFQYTVELQADEPGLLNAADQWDADLARFPPR